MKLDNQTREEVYSAHVGQMNDDADSIDEAFANLPDEIEFKPEPTNPADIVRDAAMAAARLNFYAQESDLLGKRIIDEAHQ